MKELNRPKKKSYNDYNELVDIKDYFSYYRKKIETLIYVTHRHGKRKTDGGSKKT